MGCTSCGGKKITQNIVVKQNIKPIVRSVKPSQVKVVRN